MNAPLPLAWSWSDGSAAGPECVLVPGRWRLVLRAPRWDAAWLAVDARAEGDRCLKLCWAFHARGEDAPRLHGWTTQLPGIAAPLTFPLAWLDAQRIFLPRSPGRLKGTFFGRRLEPAEIDRLELWLEPTGGEQRLALSAPRLAAVEPPAPRPPVLVDALGQWTHRTWPGRTADDADLRRRLEAELALPAPEMPGRSRYGGSLDHRFEATGWFRTHHDGRRWWLVDPEGCGFFSAGLDCVRPDVDCAVVRARRPPLPGCPDRLPQRGHRHPPAPGGPRGRQPPARLRRGLARRMDPPHRRAAAPAGASTPWATGRRRSSAAAPASPASSPCPPTQARPCACSAICPTCSIRPSARPRPRGRGTSTPGATSRCSSATSWPTKSRGAARIP